MNIESITDSVRERYFFQRYGTARMGGVFDPIMLVWFGTIATLGALDRVA